MGKEKILTRWPNKLSKESLQNDNLSISSIYKFMLTLFNNRQVSEL